MDKPFETKQFIPLTILLLGRLIGSIAVVLGIVILALPMTVIVSKFNESYGDVKRKTEQDQLKRVRAHALANGAIY